MGRLKILVTGATGYLGKPAVASCLAAGHHVVAVVRDTEKCPFEWDIDQRVTVLDTDLNALPALPDGIDVVMHLAASLSGDEAQQMQDTVQATEHLVSLCLERAPAIVLASSLSVYTGQAELGVVSEQTQLEPQPKFRDAYCRAKLQQEAICAQYSEATGAALVRLRIGAIWGPDRLWNAHLGVGIGPALLGAAGPGEIPLCHVRHAAQALALAVARAGQGETDIVNVVDSDLPSRKRYLQSLQATGWPRMVLPLPISGLATLAKLTGSRLGFGLLRLPVLRARLMPLQYDNTRLRGLGWRAEASFSILMAEAVEASRG
ncbi:MAG: NAD(P)-dependent oxidoreductase [Thalassovita sp.]